MANTHGRRRNLRRCYTPCYTDHAHLVVGRTPCSEDARRPVIGGRFKEVAGMEVEFDEQEIIQRVAALDIGCLLYTSDAADE